MDESGTNGTVLVIGSSNTDLVCRTPRLPAPGETVRGSSYATYAGGKGANQAVAAARAGASVTFAGAIGDDDLGRARLSDLQLEGIDVEHVSVRSGVPSGVASIIVDERGENIIVLVPGANDTVDPDQVTSVLAGMSPAVLSLTHEIPFESVATALEKRPPGVVSVHNAAPFDTRVAELLSLIDVLICNETEASALLGRSITADSADRAAAEIRQRGCGSVVITLGASGAFVANDGGSWHVPSPRVDVVDTTGAGDALCGTIAAWLSRGATLREAVAAGVCAGALAVTREGAQPSLPFRDAIQRLLDSTGG